jgi:hypothetical protein
MGGAVADTQVSVLRALMDEVVRARAAQDQVRTRSSVAPEELRRARRAHLRALENYALALDRLGWPPPPKLCREMHLLRSLCGVTPDHRSG